MTDSLNPYNPQWVEIDYDQEDSLWEGMKVRVEGDEPERVVAIRSYDGDQDGYGYSVTHTAVKVDKDGEWWGLHEVEFLLHELEWGQARREARLIMRKATVHVRNWGKRYGQSPSRLSHLFQRDYVVVHQYDNQGKRIHDPF